MVKFLSTIFIALLFLVQVNAQVAAGSITAPTNLQTGVGLSPTVTWDAATGGYAPYLYSYEIIEGSLLGPVIESGNTTGLNHVIATTLDYNTTYYVKITVTDDSLYTDVITSRFTTVLANPALVSPADGDEVSSLSPTFTFTLDENNDNVRYRLLLGNSAGLTVGSNLNNTTAVNPGSLLIGTAAPLLPAKKYYWAINAEVFDGGADNNGENNQTGERVFYTPLDVLNVPYNGVTGHTIEPTFEWDDVDFESGYELRISTAGGSQSNFDAGVFFTDLAIAANTTTVSYNENTEDEGTPGNFPFPLSQNTTYYWQLVATDGSNSVKSPIWHFTTYPVTTVSLWNPGTGDTLTNLTNQNFSYGINGATTGLQFKVQIKAALTTPVRTDWLTSNYTGTSSSLNQTFSLVGGTKYYWRTVLYNASNQVMAYSAPQHFFTAGGATVPYSSWPVGGATVFTNSPSLHWYLMGSGTDLTFDIEVASDTSVAAVYTATNLTGLSHTIGTVLNPSTNYFWRIQSVYRRGTPDEQISGFTPWAGNSFVTNGAGTVVVPTPSYPVDNLVIYTTSPQFYWYLGASGTGLVYDIQYGTDNTFAAYSELNDVTDMYAAISGLTPGVTYYWRVRSDNGSATSGWSAPASFSVTGNVNNSYPVVNWPVGNPTVYTTLPSLSWYLEGSSLGITGYVVKWKAGSNSANWSLEPGGVIVSGASNTFYTFTSALNEGTTYYWAVAATNGSSTSPFAEGSFTVYSVAIGGIPVLTHPVNGDVIYTTTPQLSWWFDGPYTGIVGYEIVYSYSDVFFPAATTTAYSTSTNYTVPTLVEGATYYWKVRAHYGGLSYSSYSATESFTVNPGSFGPITPIVGGPHNVAVTTTAPVIAWALPAQPAAGTSYELEYSDNINFTNSTVIPNISGRSQGISGLVPNSAYYWRVRSKNTDGSYSYYSTLGSFRVADGVSSADEKDGVPTDFFVDQNYPNPFNPETVIRFGLPSPGNVKVTVYDITGKQIATLLNEYKNAGTHSVVMNGANLASGVYLYRIESGAFNSVKKMILMK